SGCLRSVQGNFTIQSNNVIAINVLGTPLEPTTNVLLTYTGAKTGSFNPVVTVNGGSIDGSVAVDDTTPGQIKLVLTPQVAITVQPVDTIASIGDNPVFTVTATGTAPLSYQWY